MRFLYKQYLNIHLRFHFFNDEYRLFIRMFDVFDTNQRRPFMHTLIGLCVMDIIIIARCVGMRVSPIFSLSYILTDLLFSLNYFRRMYRPIWMIC